MKFAFDSSATLAQQATQGAPADVLATADTTTMDSAKSAQASTPQDLRHERDGARDARPTTPAHVSKFADLDKSSVKYVMCVTTAPCGKVGQALLDQDHITGKPVSQEVDVKSVLAKLTEGEADAGLVYTTDAVAAGDQVKAIPIPGSAQQITTYPIVTLDQSKHADLAQEFVDLVHRHGRSAGAPQGRLRRAVSIEPLLPDSRTGERRARSAAGARLGRPPLSLMIPAALAAALLVVPLLSLVLDTPWSRLQSQMTSSSVLQALWATAHQQEKEAQAPESDIETLCKQTFYPLTFPITAGPGCIVVMLTLTANASIHGVVPKLFAHLGISIAGYGAVCAGVLLLRVRAPDHAEDLALLPKVWCG